MLSGGRRVTGSHRRRLLPLSRRDVTAMGVWGRGKRTVGRDSCCEIPRFQGHRDATMTIMEVSLLTGFYPNQDDLKQVMSRAGMSWKPPTPPEWVQSACLWVKAPRLMPPRSVPQGQWPWSTLA